MKHTKMIIFLQGVITLASLAFAVGVYREGQKAEPFALDRLQDTSYMAQVLNLDPPQAQQLALLNAQLREQLRTTCQRNCEARRKLVTDIETDDLAAQEQILKEMCEAYEDGERTTLAHLQAVRALLDSVQRQTFDKLISRCLCGGCDHGCE